MQLPPLRLRLPVLAARHLRGPVGLPALRASVAEPVLVVVLLVVVGLLEQALPVLVVAVLLEQLQEDSQKTIEAVLQALVEAQQAGQTAGLVVADATLHAGHWARQLRPLA